MPAADFTIQLLLTMASSRWKTTPERRYSCTKNTPSDEQRASTLLGDGIREFDSLVFARHGDA